ncbi:MAG TPA: hypothetical protein VEQ63_04740 [Bryobacteraceae bacterium]|nr:hypothetical protein [Bryobacteraceae bacterium]
MSNPEHSATVWSILAEMVRHPVKHFIWNWNWKSALTSALLRAFIFFATNLTAGWRAAVSAMGVEFVFRMLTSGFYGSVTEGVRKAQPEWLAMLIPMILLPIVSHLIEFAVHWYRGTPKLVASVIASMCFTAFSTLFNLYAMRRGVLIVGAGGKSFWSDLKALPRVISDFLLIGPLAIWKALTGVERRS